MNSIDNLFLAIDEINNHANYKPDTIIEINRYLGEARRGIFNIIAGAKCGQTHLLIAPTGVGKSFEIINTLKEFDIKAIFILPNSANVEQAMQEYDIPGAYDNLCPINAIKNGNIVVMTWDKASRLINEDLGDYIIVIDEIHQTYTDIYRNKAIQGLYEISKKCKGRIDITATPNKLDFKIYDYITEYKQLNQTKYNVKLYNEVDIKTIIDILNKSNNSALLMNDTKELKYISNMLNKKNDVITSQTKEHSKLYDEIMFKSNMSDFEVILNTTTIVAGVNINNPKITDIIVCGLKDIGTIKQYIARFRKLKEVNVHIFNTYKEKCNVYEIEWLVSENIKNASILKDAYNLTCNRNPEFSTLGININPINLDSNVYFDKDTNTYKVNEIYIKSQIYNSYYKSRTIESFKFLLEEYFDNIEIIQNLKICETTLNDKISFKKDLKDAKEQAKQELEKHKNILVGYSEIKKNKRSFNLMEYQNINNLSLNQIQKDYFKYGIHDLILDNSLKSMINLYSKYVLENDFSIDLAWKLANLSNRKKVFGQINTIVYEELKNEYPNAFKNNYSLEVRFYEFIKNEFIPGINYTKEHLEMLVEAFKITFGDNWAFTTKKISGILNQIYNIDRVKISLSVADKNNLFYKNILPRSATPNKRIDAYTIKSRIEVQDIKKELALTSSDLGLEYFIHKRKTKILNQLDSNEKEILLEGIF